MLTGESDGQADDYASGATSRGVVPGKKLLLARRHSLSIILRGRRSNQCLVLFLYLFYVKVYKITVACADCVHNTSSKPLPAIVCMCSVFWVHLDQSRSVDTWREELPHFITGLMAGNDSYLGAQNEIGRALEASVM